MKKKNIFVLVLILLPFAGSLLGMTPGSDASASKEQELTRLIYRKDVEGVRNFLEQNSVDVNYVDSYFGSSLLASTAQRDDERSLAIADLLLKKGANINQWGVSLYNDRLDYYKSPLIAALQSALFNGIKYCERNNAMLKFLLKHNVRLNLAYANSLNHLRFEPLIMVLQGRGISGITSWDESGNPIFKDISDNLAVYPKLTQLFKERIKLLLEHGTPIPRMYGWVPDQYVDFVNKIIKEINDERLENRKSCQVLGLYHSTMENFKDPVLQTLQNVLGCKEDKPDLPLIPKKEKHEYREVDNGTVWIPLV